MARACWRWLPARFWLFSLWGLALAACSASPSGSGNPDTSSADAGLPPDTQPTVDAPALADLAVADQSPPDSFAPEAPCPQGQVNCGAGCTNLDSDPLNCGACGAPCPGGESCDGTGHCGSGCGAGYTFCPQTGGGGVCVDLDSDPVNCGGCGQGCTGAASCVDGRCQCTGGLLFCAGVCVDVSTDRQNCGGCLNACPAGQVCQAGSCGCPGGQTFCPITGGCFDLKTDRGNCGACGAVCTSFCNGAGKCAKSCIPGLTRCTAFPSTAHSCSDLNNDPLNCGGCFVSCPTGDACQNGACTCLAPRTVCGVDCVDLSSDPLNCGACAHTCPSGASCRSGACQCPTGLQPCGGACVDTATDPTNCGACGTGCPGGLCAANACSGCGPGQSLCNGACVDLQSDPLNCGTCGVGCTGGACSGGACTCPAQTVLCPPFGCVPLDTNEGSCGAPGVTCTGGMICLGGTCQTPPAPVQLAIGAGFTINGFALDNGSVFIGDAVGIEQVPEAGGPLTNVLPLSTGQPLGFAVTGGGSTFYWSDGSGIQTETLGGPPTNLTSSGIVMTSDASSLYAFVSLGSTVGQVFAIPLSGGAPTVVAQEQVLAGPLVEAAGYLFWNNGSALVRVPITGAAPVMLMARTTGGVGPLAVGAGGVFYLGGFGSTPLFIPQSGGISTPLPSIAGAFVNALWADTTGLDLGDQVDRVTKIPYCSPVPVQLASIPSVYAVQAIEADSTGLYLANENAAVFRAPR
jgi:hypothetical protein